MRDKHTISAVEVLAKITEATTNPIISEVSSCVEPKGFVLELSSIVVLTMVVIVVELLVLKLVVVILVAVLGTVAVELVVVKVPRK